MKTIGANLRNLFDKYIRLEKEIQKFIYPLSQHHCCKCFGKCCSEQICNESTESVFLSMLVERQSVPYDNRNGWNGSSGCRLEYGRPLVCYEFFCENITKSSFFKMSNIQTIINEFGSIGKNAYRNIHLICLDDLHVLSTRKIDKIYNKVNLMIKMMANTRFHSNVITHRKD